MVNKEDESHDDVGEMEDAYNLLYSSDTDPQTATPDGGSSGGSDGSSSSGGTLEFPESDSGGVDPTPTEPECPGCGSKDNVSSGVYLDQYRDRLESDHIRMLEQADYVCKGCGGVYTDE